MNVADLKLLVPGTKIRIGHEFFGDKYGADNPDSLRQWFGKEVTVRRVPDLSYPWVEIEEDMHAQFLIDEIECIVEDEELEESNADIAMLIPM